MLNGGWRRTPSHLRPVGCPRENKAWSSNNFEDSLPLLENLANFVTRKGMGKQGGKTNARIRHPKDKKKEKNANIPALLIVFSNKY